MKYTLWLLFFVLLSACSTKEKPESKLTFVDEIMLPHTSVRNQGLTQTCWAYTMASILESNHLSKTNDTIRLSVMYAVRQKYLKQFEQYYYSQGTDEIRNGSLGHSFLWVLQEKGAMPDDAYKGYLPGAKYHDHRALLKQLKNLAKQAVDKRDLQTYRIKAEALLDKHMGVVPQQFIFKGVEYTPRTFADALGFKADDYVTVTSFTHHPFYNSFILEVPDNWEHAPFYNVPLDSLEHFVLTALHNGQTVAWDGDIHEDGFSAKLGYAITPNIPVSQESRQQDFENFSTTDDHMMQIIGIAYDNQKTPYYILKNSWGKHGPYKGIMYMSQDYFRAKTISVIIPKKFVRPLSSEAAPLPCPGDNV